MTSVLILAGDTDGNLGDRAIVYSTCEELRRQDPTIGLTIVSGRPEEDREYFRATTLSRGPLGLPRLVWTALRSDRVLCGGGGLFQDDASLIKMPYWAARLAMIRAFNSHIFGFSLGVGPLSHGTSRGAGRVAFACMKRVSVRDRKAQKITEGLTSKTVALVPDPALLLTPAPDHEAEEILQAAGVPSGDGPLIGVAARRWFHHHPTWIPHKIAVKYRVRRVPGEQACRQMVSLLARVLDELTESRGARILFLPTYCVAHEADDRICQNVLEAMQTDRKSLVTINDPRQFKAVAGKLDVMLGSRMHATIFSAAMGTPVVGLSYNQKFEGFFDLIGLESHVLRIADFVEHELTEELSQMVTEALDHPTDPRPVIEHLRQETRQYLSEALDDNPGQGGRQVSLAMIIGTYRRLMASQWSDRESIEEIQQRKLVRLVRHAYERVPYYRRLFDESGLDPLSIRGPEDLDRIPITTKADLQRHPVEETVDRELPLDDLQSLHSSGSTGSPFTVYVDKDFQIIRNCMFLRALRTAGYRLGKRLMLVTTAEVAPRPRPLLRWQYASIGDSGEQLLQAFKSHQPAYLYGCVTPLRLLAEQLQDTGEPTSSLEAVLTAAETLDATTRRLLEETFRCDVYDLYGLTEMGIVGWECAAHRGFHLADETVLLEEISVDGEQDLQHLVMTNLDSLAMPFLRYDSSDIGRLHRGKPCSCGRTTTVLERVEGRLVDCVFLPDGRRISPYALTTAVEHVEGIRRYRIIQSRAGPLDIQIEIDPSTVRTAPTAQLNRVVGQVVGGTLPVRVTIQTDFPPLLGQKFRVVESRYQEA